MCLWYTHTVSRCKHTVLLHHPLCYATLSTADTTQYCHSLLFSLLTLPKKTIGLQHLYAVSAIVAPISISDPAVFITLGMNIMPLQYMQNCNVRVILTPLSVHGNRPWENTQVL